MDTERKIAYFTMEIGLEAALPTYSGGLGVLAGDTIRSAADMKVPMVAVTLLHRKGYFFQQLDPSGWQTEEPVKWSVDDFMRAESQKTSVQIEDRKIWIQAWRYEVKGISGYTVPVYFLDTDLSDNAEQDRTLSHYLYGGDQYYRLQQEIVLGMGGIRILQALGYQNIDRFHLNEGHAGLLTLALIDQKMEEYKVDSITPKVLDAVRKQCVFTTHTPVESGHDKFPMDMVRRALGNHAAWNMPEVFCCGGQLNMTYVALNLSHYINGVAKKHGEISRHMFAPYVIDAITNGVHVGTWVSKPFRDLYDHYFPGWREDNFSLRYALNIPAEQIWQAHLQAKMKLIEFVNRRYNTGMDFDIFTLGFARRAAGYKRADLLFHDLERLKSISKKAGAIQVVYSGKAHPKDQGGKELIQRIFQAQQQLKPQVKVIYISNYDMALARLIAAGVDVWLNTPKPPLEASGTSGMKAALNGVPSLSILDGWWIEGCIENVTGWAIGDDQLEEGQERHDARDAQALYQKLEEVVIPKFYNQRDRFLNIMLHAIALNGSFFNTQRMMQQYVLKAYFS